MNNSAPGGVALTWLFHDCSNCGSSFSVFLGKSMGLSVGEDTHSAFRWISLASQNLSSVYLCLSHCSCVWRLLLCLCVFKTVKASNHEHGHSICVCTVLFPFVLQEPPRPQLSMSCCIWVCRRMAHWHRLASPVCVFIYVSVRMGGFHRYAELFLHVQQITRTARNCIDLHWLWTSSVHDARSLLPHELQ